MIASSKLRKIKEESLYHYYHHSYLTPLTSQVEALDTPSITAPQSLHNLESTAGLVNQPEKAVHFNFSPIVLEKTVQNGVGTRSEEEAMPTKNGKIRNIREKDGQYPLIWHR